MYFQRSIYLLYHLIMFLLVFNVELVHYVNDRINLPLIPTYTLRNEVFAKIKLKDDINL